MKKVALTFGLFSLVTIVASFATPEITNNSVAGIDSLLDTDGGQKGKSNHKEDFVYTTQDVDTDGGQKGKSNHKEDFAYNTTQDVDTDGGQKGKSNHKEDFAYNAPAKRMDVLLGTDGGQKGKSNHKEDFTSSPAL